MKLRELYAALEERFPKEYACEWDNDGLMCAVSLDSEVKNVLCTLDVTKKALEYAVSNGFDTVISHHPMIFHYIGALTPENHIAEKTIFALKNNINVFSFHTRADAVQGGVNCLLANALGLENITAFGNEEGDIGRIGELSNDTDVREFAEFVKEKLGCAQVSLSAASDTVRKVAVLGGAGKDFIKSAISAGADLFVTGELRYSDLEEAAEMGISLIEAGHFFTEDLICGYFAQILNDLGIENAYFNSNRIESI